MKKAIPLLEKSLLASVIGFALGTPELARAALDDMVLLKGESTDTAVATMNMGGEQVTASMQQICQNLGMFLMANGMMGEGGIGGPGAELLNLAVPDGEGTSPATSAQEALVNCANTPPDSDSYSIIFTSCSMHMRSGGHLMTWAVPPGAPEAMMYIVNAETQELIGGALLETQLAEVNPVAQGKTTSPQDVRGPNGSEDWVVLVTRGTPENLVRTTETFTASIYDFDYEGTIALAGMEQLQMPAALSIGKITSTGIAHIVPDFPGSDVIGQFYQNFRNEVVPVLASNSLLTQMFEQMADLASRGVPVFTQQTITMGGGIMSMAGDAGAGTGSTSTNTISHVAVWEGGASQNQFCGYSVVPEGWSETSLDQMMAGGAGAAGGAGGPGGAGAAMTPEQQAQMNEGMNALNQAMGSMTDEQKAALSGLGLEGMIPGMGSQQAATPGGAAPGAAASAMPSSDSLMTDDVTQSVQKHLQALGYDPGNTDGTLSNETVIAISQFQFEKGLDVTGEVSPQLLGLLGAEVDSKR